MQGFIKFVSSNIGSIVKPVLIITPLCYW